jgi:hypothetical protein
MAEERSLGLTTLKIGAIAGDGGMGTSLAVLAYTEKDSAKITTTDPEVKEFFVEEVEPPIEVITTKPSVMTLEFSIHDIQPDTLIAIFGGTKAGTPAVYTPPDVTAEVEKSIEITTLTGHIMKIVRAKIIANFDWSLNRQELSRVKIKATVLTPTKAATAPYTITMPAA